MSKFLSQYYSIIIAKAIDELSSLTMHKDDDNKDELSQRIDSVSDFYLFAPFINIMQLKNLI